MPIHYASSAIAEEGSGTAFTVRFGSMAKVVRKRKARQSGGRHGGLGAKPAMEGAHNHCSAGGDDRQKRKARRWPGEHEQERAEEEAPF